MSRTAPIPELDFDTADRLRKALRFAGVSVQEMAEHLGLSRNSIGRYINGHIEPDRRTLMLWALRCGVPLDWLTGDELASQRHKRPHYQHQLPDWTSQEPPTSAEIQAFRKHTPLVRSAKAVSGS